MKRLLIAAAATALMAGSAFAQTASAPALAPERGMAGEHMRPRHHDPEKMAAHLRAGLQLRADQEPALKAFVASMTPPKEGEAMHDQMRKDHEAMAAMPAPQALDAMIAKAREHVAKLEQRAAAVKTFYAALSPAQQKAFDVMSRSHMHGMMRHGAMGGPPKGGMMGHPGED